MLATSSLVNAQELALLRDSGIGGQMDDTTECISLSTASFDDLPPNAQESLKKCMEIHLKDFGSVYLGAILIGFSNNKADEVCAAVQESIDLLRNRVAKILADN